MTGTGHYVEAASVETEQQAQDCVRRTNRDGNDESCWIRLVQGRGGRLMVSGAVLPTPTDSKNKRCALSLRLTELETQVSTRVHAVRLEPCTLAALDTEMQRGGRILAGLKEEAPRPVRVQPAPVQPAQPAPVQVQPAPVQVQPAPVQPAQPAPVAAAQPAPVQPAPSQRRSSLPWLLLFSHPGRLPTCRPQDPFRSAVRC